MRIDIQKEKIKTALLNKQTQITVSYYNAIELFQTVMCENPNIAMAIDDVKYVGLLVGGVFTVKYNKEAVLSSEFLQADTVEQIEDILHKSIRKYERDVVISVDESIDITAVFNNFLVAYQGFYSNLISMEFNQKTIVGSVRNIVQFLFKYRIGSVKLTMMETEVDKKIEELKGTLFCDGMLNETKAFIAHNYLAKTVSYWLEEDAKPLDKSYMQSAYGALINKKCVCQGYAEAYKRILDSQGITCEVICGKIKGAIDRHAWNVVSFNNKDYYHVDVTWDAGKNGSERYKYYGLKDADLLTNRIWTRTSNIICNGKDNILETARLQLARSGNLFVLKGADKKYFK
jgi:hypothetical protein